MNRLRKDGAGLFVAPDPKSLHAAGEVAVWATSQSYEPAAVSTFMQVADHMLVAQAHGHGHIVVTHEVPSNSTKKSKIPNACTGLGVKYMNPYQMLRHERARFVLGQMP